VATSGMAGKHGSRKPCKWLILGTLQVSRSGCWKIEILAVTGTQKTGTNRLLGCHTQRTPHSEGFLAS